MGTRAMCSASCEVLLRGVDARELNCRRCAPRRFRRLRGGAVRATVRLPFPAAREVTSFGLAGLRPSPTSHLASLLSWRAPWRPGGDATRGRSRGSVKAHRRVWHTRSWDDRLWSAQPKNSRGRHDGSRTRRHDPISDTNHKGACAERAVRAAPALGAARRCVHRAHSHLHPPGAALAARACEGRRFETGGVRRRGHYSATSHHDADGHGAKHVEPGAGVYPPPCTSRWSPAALAWGVMAVALFWVGTLERT
jgi:hypothetical protein